MKVNKKQLLEADTTLNQAVDKAAKEINAENTISEDDDTGLIESWLDKLLRANLRMKRWGGKEYVNIIFEGEAGSGKSSRIRAWAKKNNVILVEKRAVDLDETDLGGIIGKADDGTVTRYATKEFDELDKPRSVLFLDEFNRARPEVRAALLELINSHLITDPRVPGSMRELKGFLFTIAAINPADFKYGGTNELDQAEEDRFATVYVPSDKKKTLEYIINVTNDAIANPETPDEVPVARGQQALAKAILSDPSLEFDNAEDIEKSRSEGNKKSLSARTFTKALFLSDGTAKDFIRNIERSDIINRSKVNLIKTILANYTDVNDKANDLIKKLQQETGSNGLGGRDEKANSMIKRAKAFIGIK